MSLNSERLERAGLILIVVAVGGLAGRASFSHVVQWSIQNLPPGTDMSYGYTNAAVSELLPVGVLLFIRHRRRGGHRPGTLAWSMLIAAGLFSLTAQLAVAVPSPSGWLVAAVPTLAFMALTKLVLSLKPAHQAVLQPARQKPSPTPTASGQPSALTPGPTGDRAEPPATEAARPKRLTKRTMPRSLTGAAKVAAAVSAVGTDAPLAEIAAKAGVSVSTVSRHLPKPVESSSGKPPMETRHRGPSVN